MTSQNKVIEKGLNPILPSWIQHVPVHWSQFGGKFLELKYIFNQSSLIILDEVIEIEERPGTQAGQLID